MSQQDLARLGTILLVVGLVIATVGLSLTLGGGRYLGWLGRLPGDIRIDRPNLVVRIPLASALLISLVLSLLINLLIRRR